MADTLTAAQRSAHMAKIRGWDTGPERVVRRAVHGLGLRFRVQRAGRGEGRRKARGAALPGSPDIVLARLRIAVFVHGCFWHQHAGCKLASVPSSNRRFWRLKFARNVARDRRVARALRARGWRVFTVWECKVRSPALLARQMARLARMVREQEPSAGVKARTRVASAKAQAASAKARGPAGVRRGTSAPGTSRAGPRRPA